MKYELFINTEFNKKSYGVFNTEGQAWHKWYEYLKEHYSHLPSYIRISDVPIIYEIL